MRWSYIESEIGPIDILVNNAGMQHRAPLEDFPEDMFERVISTNLTSVFLVGQGGGQEDDPARPGQDHQHLLAGGERCAREHRALRRQQGRGRQPDTRAWRPSGPSTGSTPTRIAPGYFKTELNEALVANPEFNAWVEKRTPMGRWGDVAELGGAAIFLASDASSFVSGHILYVDGAFMATM